MSYGPTSAELAAICKRAGCRVERVESGSSLLLCRSHAGKVRLLDELGEHGARTPGIRRAVEAVATESGTGAALLVALHRLVRDGVSNFGERVETFSPALRTLVLGLGDCDDQAILLLALLRCAGFEARPAVLPPPSTGRPPRHVAPQVHWRGAWLWLEPTIDAEPGEHPLAAARRLGIQHRPDLTG